MKRIAVISFLALAVLGFAAVGVQTSRAANNPPSNVITDQQITLIRSRCGDIQATLNRIHENDKVLRVNKGYLYKAIILDKLMTPLNQRIAANQVDGGRLVAIAAEYNKAFDKFSGAYSAYERNLSAAIKIDCTKQPTAFYDQVLLAYSSRKDLYAADKALLNLTGQFKKEALNVFESIKKEAKDTE